MPRTRDEMADKTVPHSQFEAALNEISLLRDKLDSKSCALIILSQELLECKSQRDQFKLMGEQLRDRYGQLKRKMEGLGPALSGVYEYESNMPRMGSEPLTQLLVTLQEQNKHLIREIDDLRMKLEDAEGDLKIVRGQMRSMSQHIEGSGIDQRNDQRNLVDVNLVEELEFFKNKVLLLERDLQSVLDEKEELVLSRDSYKLKTERLNERLNDVLRSGSSSGHRQSTSTTDNAILMDIDGLCMENRFLKERIKSLEDEKKLSNKRLSKYKDILEKQRVMSSAGMSPKSVLTSKFAFGGSPTSPTGASSSPSGQSITNIVSARQIEQLIATDALSQLDVSPATVAHLRSLVIALWEGLQDKSTNLTHQRKTNKMLGRRIEELEKQVLAVHHLVVAKDQVKKTSSLDSSSSSIATNTTTNPEDATTPDDIDEKDDDEDVRRTRRRRDIDDDDEAEDEDDGASGDDDALPPELDRLVKEAMLELSEEVGGPANEPKDPDDDGLLLGSTNNSNQQTTVNLK